MHRRTMKIITNPKHLKKYSEPIDYKQSKQIANKMISFMLYNRRINNISVGLASNQLGLKGRVIIVKIRNRWARFINPVITYKSDEKIITSESCLSVPNKTIRVERSKEISMFYEKGDGSQIGSWDEHFSGYDALVIQHEVDHLNGKLITDYK